MPRTLNSTQTCHRFYFETRVQRFKGSHHLSAEVLMGPSVVVNENLRVDFDVQKL